jgi:hypothetical protein
MRFYRRDPPDYIPTARLAQQIGSSAVSRDMWRQSGGWDDPTPSEQSAIDAESEKHGLKNHTCPSGARSERLISLVDGNTT